MDIKKKATVDTAFLHLRDADDELMYEGDPRDDKKVGVVVFGPGSRQFAAAQARAENRSMDMLKKKGKTEKSADEKAAENADFLASITVKFENLEYEDLSGNALAMAIYSDPTLGYIGQQVRNFASEWSNFTKGSTRS